MSDKHVPQDPTTSVIISSVERALEVLIYLNNQAEPVGISQISKDMELYKSTIFRTLVTLESKKFVRQDPKTGKYSLGISLYSMAKKFSHFDVYATYADALSAEFNESINVSILEVNDNQPYKSTIIVKAECADKTLFVSPKLGSSMDCYCSSVGKCLLAFSENIDQALLQKYVFKHYTDTTITSYEELIKNIQHVRECGYAVDLGEREIGIMCIGVPILNREGFAVAAMSLSGPTVRMQHSLENAVVRLKETSAEITTLL